MPHRQTLPRWLLPLLPLAGWIALFAAHAATLGADADWDLRNYHLYNAFALLHGKLGFDLAAAQRQSFHVPVEDLLRYPIETLLPRIPRNILLVLPAALCAHLATRLADRVLPPTLPWRRLTAILAAAIGATGAAEFSTLATGMSEALPTAFILGGLLLALPRPDAAASRPDAAASRPFAAGLLTGLAVGLKLTEATYALALPAALLLTAAPSTRLRSAALAGAGLVLGALLIAGPWWIYQASHLGNPLFPYYNNLIGSPWYDRVSLTDERFKPPDAVTALLYPFLWGFRLGHRVSELPLRDPRIALGLLAALATLALAPRRRCQSARPTLFLTLFFLIAYAVWEAEFSIFRYLAPAEAISGIVLLLPLAALPQSDIRALATAGITVLIALTTVYPAWERLPPAENRLHADFPPIPPDSTVLLIQNAPLAWVATQAPARIRFIGADNNLIQPGQSNRLARQIEATIRAAAGPLWSLQQDDPRLGGDRVLAYYRLQRGYCLPVATNLPGRRLRLCRLTAAPSRIAALPSGDLQGDGGR